MTRALNYAALPATPPLTVGRLMLWLVYYAGWAAGWTVVGMVAAFVLLETRVFSLRWVSDDVVFACGPIIGAALGALLAVLARRRRWPHAVLLIVGVFASIQLARMALTFYGGGRLFGGQGDPLALPFDCFLLAGSVSFPFSGAAGLLLNRRTAR